MARTDQQLNLRLPAELKDWLRSQAERNKRSLTAEAVVILQQAQKAARRREAAKSI